MATLRIDQFIGTHQESWAALESLLRRVRGGNMRALSAEELERLTALYRHAAADLAVARRDYPRDAVTAYLNRLVAQAHPVIYFSEAFSLHRLLHFLTTTFPRLFRDTWGYTLAAFLLFLIPAVACFLVVLLVDERAAIYLLGPEQAYGVIDYFKRGEIWTKIPLPVRPAESAAIMTNNIRVIFIALAGGMLFGTLTIFILVSNGIMLGTIAALAFRYNMQTALFSFIAGHGFIELSVIFLAGGVGLMMGNALLRPGQYSRVESLSLVAGKAIRLVIGGALLLVVAGTIEGFFSPAYSLPPIVHYLVGLVSAVLLYSYWLLAGRAQPATAPKRLYRRTRKGDGPPMRRLPTPIVIACCALLLVSGSYLPTRAAPASTGARYFAQTGHSLVGNFLSYWQANGGLDRFGYPISEVIHDPGLDLDVQYVERGRLELHPEADGAVMLGRIGAELVAAEHCAFPNPSDTVGAFFPQTGQRVPLVFFDYWQTRGGLASYGYPISPAYTTSEGLVVQWFERARFELHPENAGTNYNVLLTPLGHDLLARRDALLPYLRVAGDKLVFGPDDQPTMLKGVNYSPRDHPWRLWREWDEPTMRHDFALMQQLGSNTMRVFVTFDDWQHGYYTPERRERLLQIAAAHGIRPIISLFDSYLKYPNPGWDNWPTDDSSPQAQLERDYLSAVVGPLALDPRVLAWDICNEVDYVIPYTEWVWDAHAANRLVWLRRIAAAVRRLDRAHPLTVGLTTHYGLNQPVPAWQGVGAIVDYISFHYYEHNYYDRDLDSLLTEMRGYTSLPIVVEEIGHPSGGSDLPHASEEQQRAFFATMTAQANHSAGALAWTLVDWPTLSGSEAHFGLYRADYTAKPAAAAFRDALKVDPFPITNPSPDVPSFCAQP